MNMMNNGYNMMPNNNMMNMGMNQGVNNYFTPNVNNFPHYSITQVHGQNGAEAFQMAPNSKTLLLDDTDAIIWFVQTDGAGYKTVTPYSIAPYQPAPIIDINSLNDRITALEEKINAQSYNRTTKQSKNKQSNSGESHVATEGTISAN